jgi:alpha-ribazole phosphatase
VEKMSSRQVDLIRHGEPEGGRKYRGQIDDPLSNKGWQQMWDAVAKYTGWQQIISSPLVRCSAFANELGSRLSIPVVQDERLKEIGFGAWEGKSAAQLRAHDPDCISRFLANPLTNQPPGAEPLASFQCRVVEAWQHIHHVYGKSDVLVVAHAGVIRAIIAYVLDAPLASMYRIEVANASITRLTYAQGRPPTLTFHNGVLG